MPVGIDRTFVYSVPPELADRTGPGARVEVPFRRRILSGVVVRTGAQPPAGSRVLPIRSALDPEPALPPALLELTRWIADYYVAPWGEVLRAALPQVVEPLRRRKRGGEEPPAPAEPSGTGSPTPPPAVRAPAAAPPVLTPEQAAAVEHIERRLAERAFRVVLLRGVTASGKTEVYLRAAETALRAGGQVLVLVPEIGLSVQLVDRFVERLGPLVAVLHSALTAAERRRQWEGVRAGEMPVVVGARSALFAPLVRPALIIVDEEHEGAYKQDEVPRYHARDAAVVRGQMSEALVVLGSATPSLESSYNAARGRYDLIRLEARVDARPLPQVTIADLRAFKEEEREKRRADREAAWTRRRRGEEEAPVPREEAFGGAPDSGAAPGSGAAPDSGAAPNSGAAPDSGAAPASHAAPGSGAASDSGAAPASHAAPGSGAGLAPAEPAPPAHVRNLSPLLTAALGRVIERREQAILLVYRRGHSSFVQCTDCGAVARCPSCSVALTYHAVGLVLRCHHCNLRTPAPDRCPSCDGARFWYGGVGTQRVEAEIRREFPGARLLRMDFDSTRRRGAHRAMIEAFASREADILLGTQMVAKGLDFPEVSLVGVVSADTLINLPDFRSGERSFQLLTQVAGRAGRGPIGGEVIIQTFVPDHPSVVAAATHDYESFYAAAIAERAELAYPPCGAMARFHVDGPEEEPVVKVADGVCAAIGAPGSDLTLLGPAPLPLRRLRGRERWHVTLLGRERRRVHAAARRAFERMAAAGLPARVRLQLDIDPVHLL